MSNQEALTPESLGDKEIEWNVTFHSFEQSLNGDFEEHLTNYKEHGLVRSDPGGFVQTDEFKIHAEKIFRFQPKNDDVWIVSFPKCGTTWTQEMIWMLVNDFNIEQAKQPLIVRSPFLEIPYVVSPKFVPPMASKMMINLEMIENMPSPRVIKTHLPFYLLHPNLLGTSKVVYVARNPKDVIVSYFYHYKLMKFHDFKGDVEQFAQYFMDNELIFLPFFPHVLDAWSKRNHPNMLFLFYEDLKRDLEREIKRTAAFLGKTISEEQLTMLKDHLRFENFVKNDSVNFEMPKQLGALNLDGRFIRKGKVGDWKNHFGPEINKRIDEWIDKNLKSTDLKFISELELQD